MTIQSAQGDPIRTDRIAWMDATKGFAISLVVFGHVLGGAMARDWLGQGEVPRFFYDYIYSFHMPVFFVISGALAIDQARSDELGALLSKIGAIAWPYLTWGILFMLIEPFIANFMPYSFHASGPWEAVRRLALGETSWFLWTLFLAHCVLIITAKLWTPLVLFLSVCVYMVFSGSDLGTIGALIRYMPFMALGAALGRRALKLNPNSGLLSLMASALLFGVLFAMVTYRANEVPALYLLCGIVGSVASVMAAQFLDSVGLGVIFANVGAASLVIFLLHSYFQGASRELVLRTVGPSPLWQLILPTVLAILGPTLTWMTCEWLGLSWFFRLDLKSAVANRVHIRRSLRHETRTEDRAE